MEPIRRHKPARLRAAGRPVLVNGRRLKALREAEGISVKELSERANVSTSWIYGLQRGPHRGVWSNTETIKSIAAVLGVPSESLYK
jgi:transcriptional regulator with XRE-family HTH domain